MLWEINQINEYHIKKVIWNMFKTHIMKKKWSSLATNKPKFEQQNFFFCHKTSEANTRQKFEKHRPPIVFEFEINV